MLVIIDYGMGNLGSIKNIIKKIGSDATISNDKQTILNATKLILPGVGNFKEAMINLQKLELISILNQKVLVDKTPILGICLGMQLMTSFSEEGQSNGLNWISAKTTKFNFESDKIKVPHMGWNEISIEKESPFNQNFEKNARFYFVHSYFVTCDNNSDILHATNYFKKFTSAFNRGNIYGVQYHPEKSHSYGFQLIKNFIDLC